MNPTLTEILQKNPKSALKKAASCILLLDTNEYLGKAAETFCKMLFNVRCITRSNRAMRKLPEIVEQTVSDGPPVDYLFNFLSPLKISKKILESAKVAAINFHPAPPEHPGVGCASYAIFEALTEGKWEYGVSAHLMEEEYDAGAILKVLRFPIAQNDYCDTLFDRALNYTLMLYYEVLFQIATQGMLEPSGDLWRKKSGSRKEFEAWMTLKTDDPQELVEKKIRASRHSRFYGPYLEVFGERFALPPREIE
jgi:methionyl-tRNA formyltransferase